MKTFLLFKRVLKSIPTLVLVFLLIMVSHSNAQEQELTKEQIKQKKYDDKVVKLKEKVAKAQAKVDAAHVVLAYADSLLQVSEQQDIEASNEIKQIKNEEKSLRKIYNTDAKLVSKAMKSRDPDEAKEASNDLKALDKQYKIDFKANTVLFKAADKKAALANKNYIKGKEKEKVGKTKLKDAQKALELAEEALADFTAPKDTGKKKKKK